MAEDRRSARRAHVPAVRATYEGATGDRKEAEVFDLSRDGLFLKTDNPIPVGKRLSLEIRAAGQAASWPALGRVIWTRTSAESELRPSGMAVKLIDIDDSVSETIDRLVQAREPTDRGLGTRAAPPRERTILGVGLKSSSPQGPAPASSAPLPAPARPAPRPAPVAVASAAPPPQGSAPIAAAPPAPLGPDPVVAATPPAAEAVVAVATVIVSEPPPTPVPFPLPADDASLEQEHPLALRGDKTRADPSIAIDLVARKSEPDHIPAKAAAPDADRWNDSVPAAEASSARRPPHPAAPVAHTIDRGGLGTRGGPDAATTRTGPEEFGDTSEEEPPFVPKRRGRRLFAILVVLIAAAIAAYLYQDALLAQWKRVAPALHRLLGH